MKSNEKTKSATILSLILLIMTGMTYFNHVQAQTLPNGKPESFTEETITEAKNRGIRGTILTTEMDRRLEVQKDMVELLKSTGFEHQFIVTPNISHWFPDDIDKKIDETIEFIQNK